MSIVIGVDIGGSHISSAAIHQQGRSLIKGTYFCSPVDNKASKDHIFSTWATTIKETIYATPAFANDSNLPIGIAFSMPGPFHYHTGIAMFEGNDKYEALFNVNVGDELKKYLKLPQLTFRFLNDASCFAVGGSLTSGANSTDDLRVVAITLGTGFGAAFLQNKIPVTNGDTIPENGCLWDKTFGDGIADSYFSTRWFVQEYEYETGVKLLGGVKEMVELNDAAVKKVFQKFTQNLSVFIMPFLRNFAADILVIGGNIAKSHSLFLTDLKQQFANAGLVLPIAIIENTEETSIFGAAYLYNEVFWGKIKEELPHF